MKMFLELLDTTDLTLFGLLILVDILLWKKNISHCLYYALFLFLLGFVLPLWSSGREVDRNVAINGPAMDNFELVYVFLVFPVYWLLLLLQLIYMAIKPKPFKVDSKEDILDQEI